MSADTAELARLAAAVEKRRAAQKAQEHLEVLAVRRNLCWIAAGFFFLTAVFLSIGFWAGKLHVPTGVISWLGPGLTTFAILGGLAIQMNLNKRQVVAEVRDARPADNEVIGRLAAQQETTQVLLRQLQDQIAELMPLLRDAYEAGFRDGAGASAAASPDGGVGGTVIQMPSQETISAIKRLARKTTLPPEDNSEDRRA